MEMGRQNKGYDSGQDYRVVRVVLTPDIRPGLDNRHLIIEGHRGLRR